MTNTSPRITLIMSLLAFCAGCSETDSRADKTTMAVGVSTAVNSMGMLPEFSAREPAPDSMSEKPVLREVAVLDNKFLARIDALEAVIEQEPTNSQNVASRLKLMQAYYDALQGQDVLLNYFTNQVFNRISTVLARGVPVPDNSLDLKALDRLFAELRQIQAAIGKTGSFRQISPDTNILEAKAYYSIVLEYEVGELGMDVGARIRIGHNWYADVGEIQFSRPLDAGYTTITPSREGLEFVSGPQRWYGQQFTSLYGAFTPTLTLTKGRIEPGETITFHIGDKSGGAPGWLTQSFSLDSMDLKFEADFENDGLWVPIAQPRFRVIGNEPHHLRIVAPSVVRPGEPVSLRVNVEDQYFNEASSGPIELIASIDGREVGRSKPVGGNPGRFLFPAFDAPVDARDAPYYLDVVSIDDRFSGQSNPMMVRAAPAPKLFWGEMHGHEAYTDGNGTPDWYLSYAKDVAFLDYASLTGHDVMLSELHFRDIFRATREFNDPEDGFVTFPAYEWTAGWGIGGHHNIFHQDESQRVLPTAETGTLSNMLASQRKFNDPDKVLIIPHAHQPGDWTKLDDKFGSLVEIYSTHGSFEWFGRRYLQQGYQVGFNAASDDHIGHPGNSPARAWTRGGIAAVFAQRHGRESIFKNLKSRHTYGTSLARIYLETAIGDGQMGDVVSWPAAHPVELSVLAAGTAPITSIGVVVNGEDVLVEDYTRTDQDTRLLWFRITSASEPNNPARPRSPADGVRYWGFVDMQGSNNPLEQVEGLGIEPYGDVAGQISGNSAAFSLRVRGDYDALLLSLKESAAVDTVKIRIWRSDMDEVDNWNIQKPGRLPGEFERDLMAVPHGELVVDTTIALSELLGDGVGGKIEKDSRWDMSFAKSDLPKWQQLKVSLDEEYGFSAEHRNNVYVRVKQLDDQTAWSSPIFIDWE